MAGKSKTVYIEFDGKMVKLDAKMRSAISRYSDNASRIEKATNKMSKDLIGLGSAYLSMRSIEYAIDKHLEFTSGIRNANTILKYNEEQLGRTKKEVLDLSKTYGVATKELTDGLYQTASAGYTGADAMYILEASTRASIAGNNKLETSVDGITTVLNAWHMNASEATRVSDYFFKTVERGKTTMEEAGSSIAEVAPLAASSGIPFKEIGAALQTITKQGTKTPQAITQIRASIVSANEILGDGWAKTMSYQDAMGKISEKAKGSQNNLKNMMGRIEGVNAVLAMTGDNAITAKEDLEAMNLALGATATAFNEQAKSPEFKLNKIKEQGNSLLMTFIDNFGEGTANLLGGTSIIIDNIVESFSNFDATDLIPVYNYWKKILEITKTEGVNLTNLNEITVTYKDSLKDLNKELREQERLSLSKLWDETYTKMQSPGISNDDKRALEVQLKTYEAMAKAFDEIDKPVTPIKKTKPGSTEDEIKKAKEKEKEKERATESYFNSVKWLNDDYEKFRKEQINKEVEELREKVGSEIDLELYKNNKLKELEQEKKKEFGPDLWGYESNWNDIATRIESFTDEIEKEFLDAELKRFGYEDEHIREAHDARMRSISELGNAMEGAFSKGGDDLARKINGVVQTVLSVLSIANSMGKSTEHGGTDQTTGVLQLLGVGLKFLSFFSEGGSATVGNNSASVTKPYKKFGRGTIDYVVPPGYNKDDYYVGLTSGETIDVYPNGVTPPRLGGDSGMSLAALRGIKGSIEGMHENLMYALIRNKSNDSKLIAKGVLEGDNISLSVERSEKFKRLYG